MLRFRNGLLCGTSMTPEGADLGTGGGGGNGAAPNAAFLASLPETIRGHEAFKDVKDPVDLATRYHKERTTPFAERLPESVRNEAYFKDIKSYDDLAVKAFNQAKLIGRDPNTLITLPQDPKDEKGWNDVWTKLGRPEAADKYVIPPKRVDGKDYTPEDKAFQQGITPILHKAGITQSQLARLLPEWDGLMDAMTKGSVDAANAEFKKEETALRAELGAAYEDHLGMADGALAHLDKQLKLNGGLVAALDRAKLANNPALFKVFAHIGAQLKEDGLLGKDTSGHGGGLSPAQARQAIAALEAEEAWKNADHPQHADAIAKRKELFGMAYPEG